MTKMTHEQKVREQFVNFTNDQLRTEIVARLAADVPIPHRDTLFAVLAAILKEQPL
jgi:hypothetical protein